MISGYIISILTPNESEKLIRLLLDFKPEARFYIPTKTLSGVEICFLNY